MFERSTRGSVVLLMAMAVTFAIGSAPRASAAQGNPLQKLKRAAEEAAKKAKEGAKSVADSVAESVVGQPAPEGSTNTGTSTGSSSNPPQPTPAAPRGTTTATAGGAIAKSSARMTEQVLLSARPGVTYVISPKRQNVAAVMERGSRTTVVYNGVDGPIFDEIKGFGTANNAQAITFSDDGSRWAYVGRLGRQLVYMVDGKEFLRLPVPDEEPSSVYWGPPEFDESGKRIWFMFAAHPTRTGGTRLYIDDRPGPEGYEYFGEPVFSRDGSRHAFMARPAGVGGNVPITLFVDGKPAGYLGGNPQFGGDGKLYSQRTISFGGGEEVLVEGKLFLKSPAGGSIRVYPAPAGPLVLSEMIVASPGAMPTSYLVVGDKRVTGSECRTIGYRIHYTPDAKHWAAVCPHRPGFVIANGKKGREYQSITTGVRFTADGRPVYQATVNQKQFVVVGEQESDPYTTIGSASATVQNQDDYGSSGAIIGGNRIGFIARADWSTQTPLVVVDWKATEAVSPDELSFSANGARYAYVAGHPARRLFLDGVEQQGFAMAGRASGSRQDYRGSYALSPDGKYVAYEGVRDGTRGPPGLVLNGKFLLFPDISMFSALTFSPDGKHLAFIGRKNPRQIIFLDGEPVLELPFSGIEGQLRTHWSMSADGVLTLVAQDGDKIKRFTITPGEKSGVEAMLARAK